MARSKDFFAENQNLFSSAQNEPEKYNLYGGLYALAEEVENLNRTLRDIEGTLNNIQNRLQYLESCIKR